MATPAGLARLRSDQRDRRDDGKPDEALDVVRGLDAVIEILDELDQDDGHDQPTNET